MTNKQHPYADVLRAIADGERVQLKTYNGEWVDVSGSHALQYITVDEILRVKPATIRIGEYDVPEPVRHKMNYGDRYYVLDTSTQDLVSEATWSDDTLDTRWLYRGLIHLDKESAIMHAKALISLSEKK